MSTKGLHLHTDRPDLVLSQVSAEDDNDYFASVQASRPTLERFLGNTARYQSVEQVANARQAMEQSGDLRMAIWSLGDGVSAFAGCVDAHFDSDNIAQVSYWVDASRRGDGVGKAALRAMVTYLLTICKYVYAMIEEENTVSIRTAEAAGFKFETEARPGCFIYTITPSADH